MLEYGDQKLTTKDTKGARRAARGIEKASFARLGRPGRLPLRVRAHCLDDQQEADCGQGYVDIFQEGVALEAMVEGAAQEDGGHG